MKLIFSLLVCSILMSCGSTSKIERIDSEALEVQLKDLVDSPEKYQGRLVKFNAYLIGSEFTQYEDAQIFVLCLADETLLSLIHI